MYLDVREVLRDVFQNEVVLLVIPQWVLRIFLNTSFHNKKQENENKKSILLIYDVMKKTIVDTGNNLLDHQRHCNKCRFTAV